MTETTDESGVTVIVTSPDPEYTDGRPDDVVIFIDTDGLDPSRRIRIRINDALIFEGTPGHGEETVHHNQYDGHYITQEEQP